jgi:hypothetical protein
LHRFFSRIIFPFSSTIEALITARHSGHNDFVDLIDIHP